MNQICVIVTVLLLQAAFCPAQLMLQTRHELSPGFAIDATYNGTHLAIWRSSGIDLYTLESGSPEPVYTIPQEQVRSIALGSRDLFIIREYSGIERYNLDSPVLAGFVPLEQAMISCSGVVDNHLFFADVLRGLEIYDIPEAGDPVLVGSENTVLFLNNSVGTTFQQEGDLLLCCEDGWSVKLFDVSDMRHPVALQVPMGTTGTILAMGFHQGLLAVAKRDNTSARWTELYTYTGSDGFEARGTFPSGSVQEGSLILSINDMMIQRHLTFVSPWNLINQENPVYLGALPESLHIWKCPVGRNFLTVSEDFSVIRVMEFVHRPILSATTPNGYHVSCSWSQVPLGSGYRLEWIQNGEPGERILPGNRVAEAPFVALPGYTSFRVSALYD